MRMEWSDQAACRGTDPEAYFPAPHVGMSKLVKKICNSCPVQAECLEYSVSFSPVLEGVWGGLGTKDRERMMTRRRRYAS